MSSQPNLEPIGILDNSTVVSLIPIQSLICKYSKVSRQVVIGPILSNVISSVIISLFEFFYVV